MTLNQRVKQRLIAYHLGITFVIVGALSFFLVGILVIFNLSFQWATEMLAISLSLIVYGVLSSMIFSQLGWNKSALIDILLNQLGVFITTIAYIGLCIHFLQGKTNQSILLYLVITILGLLLVGLGMKYHTYS